MRKENEEVLTTTSSQGDTSFMVCKTDEENKNQKVCMDVDNPNPNRPNKSANPAKPMLDNNTYDLMEQLLNREQESLAHKEQLQKRLRHGQRSKTGMELH